MSIIGRILLGMMIMTMPLAPVNAVYNVDAIRARIADVLSNDNQNPSGKYYRVCGKDKGKSNLKEFCVEDIFKPTNVQMMQATALAKMYANKENHNVACSSDVVKSWNDDYVACSDGKTVAYEFRFDDVYESADDTIQRTLARAVCEMTGGKFDETYGVVCYLGQSCDVLRSRLQVFGYDAELVDANMNQTPYCKIDFNSVRASDGDLRTVNPLSPYKFSNLQIRSQADLTFIIKRYVEMQLGTDAKVQCNHSFNTLKTGKIDNPKDDILTCYVNGQPVDFVFDDLQEAMKYQSDAGLDGLQCIAVAGGVFDGRRCHGLTRAECDKLGKASNGGVVWEESLETCRLNSAMTADRLNSVGKALGLAALTVVGTAVTVATAGMATPLMVVISTSAVAGSALTTVGLASSAVANEELSEGAAEFLGPATQCIRKMKEAGDVCMNCAYDSLRQYMLGFYSKMDLFVSDPQLSAAMDDVVPRLFECVLQDDENAKKAAIYSEYYDDDTGKRVRQNFFDVCVDDYIAPANNALKTACFGQVAQMVGSALDLESIGTSAYAKIKTLASTVKLAGLIKAARSAKVAKAASASTKTVKAAEAGNVANKAKVLRTVDRAATSAGAVSDVNTVQDSDSTVVKSVK